MKLDKKTMQLGRRTCMIALFFAQTYFRDLPKTWMLIWWAVSPVYFYFCGFGTWNIVMGVLMAPASLGLFLGAYDAWGLGVALGVSTLFSVLGVMLFFKKEKTEIEEKNDS